MSNSFAVFVDSLTVHYDRIPVLWDVGFTIPQGLIVGVIGPNGAGKSTLFKAMLGIVRPVTGEISFLGKPLSKMRQKIAYVPQRASVDWDFPITVEELVLMGSYNRLTWFQRPSAQDRQAALKAMEMVDILEFRHHQIGELSGGQQQRAFLARALLQKADLYFMDEPFSGIDATTEKSIIQILHHLKSEGKTVFVIHHDLHNVQEYFDWILLLNTCVIACGPVAEVFTQENISRTYGQGFTLMEEAAKISQNKFDGRA